MFSMTRSLLRWGLFGALALGGATLLVGPNLVAAGLDQVRSRATSIMDEFVDDPVALRRQLASLGEQYPERIAQVRGELASVSRQIQQLERDTEIARRVVANTTDDLDELKELIAEAEATSQAKAVPVSIRTRGVRLDIGEARVEARRVADIRLTYQDRIASNEHQIRFLSEQKSRLDEISGKLASEFGAYESKLAQVDRQIDAIERNDRLIEMTREQKAILAEYEKFGRVGNLDQLEAKLAELQAVQEAQLEALSKVGVDRNYEREAAQELHDETTRGRDLFEELEPTENVGPPAPIRTGSKSVAMSMPTEPIVIERRK